MPQVGTVTSFCRFKTMTKRIVDIGILLVGIAFVCWYLPVAYNNVYACDDYWFGTNVRIYGLWEYQIIHWLNWEGSYTHTFLASLPHAFHYPRMPFIGNLFSLILLYVSLFAFLRNFTNITTKRCLSNTLYFISLVYLCTKGDSEIRFWICANITYIPEMSFLLLFFVLYHNLNNDSSFYRWLFIIVLTFLVGGSKLSYILYAIVGLATHDILYNRSIKKHTFLVYLFLAIFVILNISAPGNYIRLDAETMPKTPEDQMTMLEAVLYRFVEMLPYMVCTIFLFPIAAHWKPNYSYREKRVVEAFVILFFAFILDGIIMYICFNDPGPLRVYFITEVFAAIFVLFLLNHLYSSFLSKYKVEMYLSLLFSIWVTVSNVPMFIEVRDSIEFSYYARERDKYVASYTGGDTIKINSLPNSHLLLSYFANDKIWLENIYMPYFQKQCEVILYPPQEYK